MALHRSFWLPLALAACSADGYGLTTGEIHTRGSPGPGGAPQAAAGSGQAGGGSGPASGGSGQAGAAQGAGAGPGITTQVQGCERLVAVGEPRQTGTVPKGALGYPTMARVEEERVLLSFDGSVPEGVFSPGSTWSQWVILYPTAEGIIPLFLPPFVDAESSPADVPLSTYTRAYSNDLPVSTAYMLKTRPKQGGGLYAQAEGLPGYAAGGILPDAPGPALFVALKEQGVLFGAMRTYGGVHRLDLALCSNPSSSPCAITFPSAACASEALAADSLGLDGGVFWLATSSGSADGSCDKVGAPTRLRLLRIEQPGQGTSSLPEEIDVIETGQPVRFVRLLPRSDGAWLLFGAEDAGGVRLRMARLDAQGKPSAPLELTQEADAPAQPAVAWLADDRVAAAWIEQQGAKVRLQVVNGQGAVTEAAVEAKDAEQVAVLGHPSGWVVLAWQQAQPSGPSRMMVARYACKAD